MSKFRSVRMHKEVAKKFHKLKEKIKQRKVPFNVLKVKDNIVMKIGDTIINGKLLKLEDYRGEGKKIKLPGYYKAAKGKKGLLIEKINGKRQEEVEFGLIAINGYLKDKNINYVFTRADNERMKDMLIRHNFKEYAVSVNDPKVGFYIKFL